MLRFVVTFFFILLWFQFLGQYNITFSVNLNANENFNPSIHQVYVSGAKLNASEGLGNNPQWPMPGSNPAFLMSAVNDSIFELTFEDNTPGVYAYKYFIVENGQPSWVFGEWPGTNNRLIVLENGDIEINDTWGIILNDEVELRINEIMASNGTTIADEDGDYEDWIEIYNAGSQPVNLNGFGLSDDEDNPMRWIFPSVYILPDSYLIVWASGKNRVHNIQSLHTNFSISSAGENILLSDVSGQLLDQLPAVEHQTDIAYGRFPNASESIAYLSNPTPNAQNSGPSFNALASPLQFSVPEGYYESAISVSITSEDPNAVIRYTLDGSEPKPNSPIFTEPITLDNLVGVPNEISEIPTNNQAPGPPFFEGWEAPNGEVYKINVLRAKAFSPFTPPASSFNATYIIDPLLHQRFSLPMMSLTSDFENLFDPQSGIYVYGNSGNYWQDWERGGNFTYFRKDGSLGFNENVGFQLNGNTTRNRPRKSIRMVFRNQYGNSWLNHPVFENKSTNRYKRLILRNAGNDWGSSLIRDGLSQILAKDFNHDIQCFQPTIMFINGEYWGIHNLRDRFSTHYFKAKYDMEPHEITVMENNASFKRGNPDGVNHYENLIAFAQSNNLSSSSAFEQIRERMDVESFIDFQLTHIYPKNTDWPGNNVMYWRYLSDDFNSNAGVRDGRWRWLIFDLDFAFDLDLSYVPFVEEGPAHNTLAFALESNGPSWPNPNWSTFLLRRLMTNELFKIHFVNRYCDLLNTVYRLDFVTNTIDSLKNMLLPEMEEHINRWRSPESLDSWLTEIAQMKQFAGNRAGFQFQHLQNTLSLGDKYELTVDVSDSQHGYVHLNSISLLSATNGISDLVYPWKGAYLQGAPITLRAIPKPGYVFSHWSGDITSNNAIVTIDPFIDTQVKANFLEVESSNFELLHFWFFGSFLQNNLPFTEVFPTFTKEHAKLEYTSCLTGYPFSPEHPDWRRASLERRNMPTILNYNENGNNNISFESSDMRGLQVRQPFISDGKENTILLKFSTKDYEKIMLRLAVKDEGAVSVVKVDYNNPAITAIFSSAGIIAEHAVDEKYKVIQVNFDDVQSARDADTLIIRLLFFGDELEADNGNRVTFNNISISGVPISEDAEEDTGEEEQKTILYPNPAKQTVYVQVSSELKNIAFYSSSGKLVANQETKGNEVLDISNLASGVYFVRLNFVNGNAETKRLVKIE